MLALESSLSSAWVSNFKQLYAFITCKIRSATYPESFSSGSDDFFSYIFYNTSGFLLRRQKTVISKKEIIVLNM